MDENNQVNSDASVQDVDTSVDNDTNDTSGEDTRYLNQKLRAEKAEKEKKELEAELARLKGAKPEVKENTQKPNITNDRDESYLVSLFGAKGLSYDEVTTYLEKAKKIAEVEGVPLAKAVETDFFKVFDKSYQDQKKAEKASMGASRGSGNSVPKKDFNTPGLSDQEFDTMLKKQIFGK